MKKPETMNPPAVPCDKANAEELLQRQIIEVDFAMRQSLAGLLEAGYRPSAISGGLIVTIYNLMKAQGMTEMQISNELNRIVDGVREMAFVENKKLN